MAEKKLEYDLMPNTPLISEGYEEKKKKGLMKLFSNLTKKKSPILDKSSSIAEAARFEAEDEGGRRSISLLTPDRNQSDDDREAVHPTDEFPENIQNQNIVDNIQELLHKHRDDEASEEEIETKKLHPPADDKSLPNLMEGTEELIVQEDRDIIDASKKEHLSLEESDASPESNEEDGLKLAGRVEEEEDTDPITTTTIGNATGEEEEEEDEKANLSPTTQEKEVEVIGCKSLAKGLQKMCLPWTITKQD